MNCGTLFQIYDDCGELMRIVNRKEEALAIVSLRSGWTYKRSTLKKPTVKFEEALF